MSGVSGPLRPLDPAPDGSATAAPTVAAASVYLHPGQLAAAARPTIVTTILGSCVSLCLYDARRGVAGINHFLLPASLGALASPRFGDVACAELLERVLALGADRGALQGKLFGGACVLDGMAGEAAALGERNADVAIAFLERERIPLQALDTGGRRGRKLRFSTWDGIALVRSI